ncbi:MAG: hydrogenase maturation nickel metallochaperone HypA [Phycisphaerae bacterium]
MHELSVAQHLIEIVADATSAEQDICVRTISLRVGEQSGIDQDALRTAFASARRNTVCHHAVLCIELTPTVLQCPRCGPVQASDAWMFACSSCDALGLPVVTGQELEVVSIEVDDASSYAVDEPGATKS